MLERDPEVREGPVWNGLPVTEQLAAKKGSCTQGAFKAASEGWTVKPNQDNQVGSAVFTKGSLGSKGFKIQSI